MMFELFQNYAFVLLGNGTASVLSFLISILLSRSMSVEGFGVYSLYFTILVLVWQIPAFIDSSFVRFARAAGREKAGDYLRVNLVFKIRTAALILALSPFFGWILARWIVPGKAACGILVMAVAGGAFLTFLTSLTADFQAREKYFGYALGNIVYYVGVLSALGLLVRRGPITASAAAVTFLAVGAAAGVGAFFVLARRAWPLVPLDAEAASNMRRLGRWILCYGLLYVVLQRTDVLIVGHFFSKAELGVYAAASRFQSSLGIFLNAAGSLYLPKAALAASSRTAMRAYGREAVWLSAVILLAVAVLVVFAPGLMTLFFGTRYASSAGTMRILVLGTVPQILSLPLTYLLYGLDDSFSNFAAMALCLGVNLTVNLIFTPRIGLTGPGWALGAGYLAYLGYVLAAVFVRRRNRARLAAL
jgi:O-antigen/teichoic acid export membrane protein